MMWRITAEEIVQMNKNKYSTLRMCLQTCSLRLIGISWKKYWRIEEDIKSGDIVIIYE